MPYKFNPVEYDMLSCVECGTGIPLMNWDVQHARVALAADAREVPGLYVCKACGLHATHVAPSVALAWLAGTLIPEGLKFALDVARNDTTDLETLIGGALIMQDVETANELAGALWRALAGAEAQDAPGPAATAAPEMRREEDGTVSYACPNAECPDGRHNFTEMADKLPINIVAALIGTLPELSVVQVIAG